MASSVKAQIKAVALDFDGPITNLDVDWNAAIRQASKIAGTEIKSLITFYENCHGTAAFQKVSAEMEQLELCAVVAATPKPYIEEFLKALQEKRVPVFIVSMQSQKPIKTFLDRYKLTGYFCGVITRQECPTKTAQIQLLAKQTSLTLSQILLVDDNKRHLSNCQQIGAACFLFKRNQKPKATRETWNQILKLASTSQI